MQLNLLQTPAIPPWDLVVPEPKAIAEFRYWINECKAIASLAVSNGTIPSHES